MLYVLWGLICNMCSARGHLMFTSYADTLLVGASQPSIQQLLHAIECICCRRRSGHRHCHRHHHWPMLLARFVREGTARCGCFSAAVEIPAHQDANRRLFSLKAHHDHSWTVNVFGSRPQQWMRVEHWRQSRHGQQAAVIPHQEQQGQ
jgi:hypothetical protein